MKEQTPDGRPSGSRSWLVDYPRALPVAIFLLIAAVTALSIFAIERGQQQRRTAQLNETAQAVGSALERRSYAVSAYLRSGAALFEVLDGVSSNNFRRFVDGLRLDTDYRAAEGIGWAKAMEPSEQAAFETEISDSTGIRVAINPTPTPNTQLIVPVTYFYPRNPRDAGPFGYDMYSDEARSAAMEASIRNLRPTASGLVTLVQEGQGTVRGFLIYMPVFEGGISGSKLRGFVYSPYDGELFLKSALEMEKATDASFRLYDGHVSPEALLAETRGEFTDGLIVNEEIMIANRPMILQTEIGSSSSLSTLSMLTALFGLMVGCLLSVVARLLTQQATEDQARIAWFEQQNSIRNTLTRELNHRVKNTLANVLSIIQLTRRRADNLDDFATGLDGRIRALSATHDLLTQSDWGTTPIRSVIEAELAPYRTEGGETPEHGVGQSRAVEISGPDVELAPNDALSLGLAVHELATNAAKYGALSQPGGMVSVTWVKVGEKLAKVHWEESGGPPVAPERKRGFGTDLIEKVVAHELRSKVDLNFDPGGVTCSMMVPVRERSEFAIRAQRRKTLEEADAKTAASE